MKLVLLTEKTKSDLAVKEGRTTQYTYRMLRKKITEKLGEINGVYNAFKY